MYNQILVTGLASISLLGMSSAAPLESVDAAITKPEVFSMGTFVDPVYNQAFELYNEDSTLLPSDAFANYLAAYNETVHLNKRGWYNCKNLNSNIKTAGCNTAHGLGNFVSATGSGAMGGYISTLLSEAFKNKRDNKSPRSVCLSRDGNNLCVSWATYDAANLKAGENTDIENFSVSCAQSGGSSEYKTVMADNGILFICVSDRATGCGQSVC